MVMPIPRIVVVLEGGLVQDVVADLPLDVLVVDRDVDGYEGPEMALVRGRPASVVHWDAPELPEVVAAYFEDARCGGLLP